MERKAKPYNARFMENDQGYVQELEEQNTRSRYLNRSTITVPKEVYSGDFTVDYTSSANDMFESTCEIDISDNKEFNSRNSSNQMVVDYNDSSDESKQVKSLQEQMHVGNEHFKTSKSCGDQNLVSISMHTSYGTTPYLGTFLTDLTMIHAAIPDTLPDGLINFDKKRKEFEVLAQIKLLQGVANTYQLRENHLFDRWFASMLILDEREAHTLSCQLEPLTEPRRSNSSGHQKTDSMTSNSSSDAGSQFYCDMLNNGTLRHSSRHNSLDRDATPSNPSILSASSSVSNLSGESSESSGQKFLSNMKHVANGKTTIQDGVPIINAQLVQASPAKNSAPNFYIIRVTYETDHVELDGIVLYKSIILGNNERTPQVIRNAMMKLGLEDDPDKYTLAQVLPDKELVMPANANVYYAVNTNYNLNFILRMKRD